jgi:hypothetical protein
MSKISSVNEFIYQGLENSIQLELGTLLMRSSEIRRDDDDDDFICRDTFDLF